MKIVKFSAIWCPECLIMRPRWKKIQADFPEQEIEDIDADAYPEKKKAYGVDHIPTIIFYDRAGAEIERVKTLMEIEEIAVKINNYQDK